MDVRTICLGILTRGDATGYEIKKLFEEGPYSHFLDASFGSIYPALTRLTEEELVTVREEAQDKRPDRKVYSITEAGKRTFIEALSQPLPADRYRSPFLFALLFAHLLPRDRVQAMIDRRIAECEQMLAHLDDVREKANLPGERYVIDHGRAVYAAMLEFLRAQRTVTAGKERVVQAGATVN